MADISDRIALFIKTKGLSIRSLEQQIGCSNGVIARCINKGTDISSLWVSKIIEKNEELDALWLLTGKGSMLRGRHDNDNTDLHDTLHKDTIVYRMYKEEKEEKDRLLKEKDAKIEMLQSEILRKSEELAALRAIKNQSQKSDHKNVLGEHLEAFTSQPLEDYGEDFSSTSQASKSKKSSRTSIGR